MSTSEHSKKANDARGPTPVCERSSYDVLEVAPDATREEIEAAYRRALRIIEGNSLGGYLMLDPEARESAKREVERAFQVLTNPQERARLDREASGEQEPPRESASEKGGRRARRRRKREAARRARAERSASESQVPRSSDAPTLPVRPALEEDADEQAVTLITSAEAEPILDDDPLELPPAPTPPAVKAAPAVKPAPAAEVPVVAEKVAEKPAAKVAAKVAEKPPPLPPKSGKPKKPLLRFLSPVVEVVEPEPSANPPTPDAPSQRLPPSPAEASEPGSEPSAPPVSRKPWLYSDAGTEGVAEPRVISRANEESDEEVSLPPESEINGGVIRRLREARGISLEELAEQTHIRKTYLKAIEEQNLDELPARVYLRGFLTQIARVLKVDKRRLAEGYMSFVGRFGK